MLKSTKHFTEKWGKRRIIRISESSLFLWGRIFGPSFKKIPNKISSWIYSDVYVVFIFPFANMGNRMLRRSSCEPLDLRPFPKFVFYVEEGLNALVRNQPAIIAENYNRNYASCILCESIYSRADVIFCFLSFYHITTTKNSFLFCIKRRSLLFFIFIYPHDQPL